MSKTHQWPIDIVDALGICGWIDDQGGPTGITTSHIFTLIQSRNTQTPIQGYTFIPDTKKIYGCIQYRNDNISGGNFNTGCVFQ